MTVKFSLNSYVLNTIEVAMSMDSKRLETRTAIVAMGATAIVLFGGFAIPSVYAQATQVKSDFESSLTSLCSPEEVFFSGIMHLVLGPNDVNGRQTGYVNYINTKGVSAQTGTQFTVHEIDHITIVTNENGDIKPEK